MKQSKLLLAVILLGVATTACQKEVVVNPSTSQGSTSISNVEKSTSSTTVKEDLPSAARDFLKEHYLNTGIAKYEVKNAPIVGNSTEVQLVNGVEVDFDSTGNWLKVKDPQGVKSAIVPANIKDYVTKNYTGVIIQQLEKEKDKIKVELSNDIDLEFDKSGNFIRIEP